MPNAKGRFGNYGGQFVPETVMTALQELEDFYAATKSKPDFQEEFSRYLREYAGRPTLLYFAENLSRHYGRAKIYLKREDLLHTGAHKSTTPSVRPCLPGEWENAALSLRPAPDSTAWPAPP